MTSITEGGYRTNELATVLIEGVPSNTTTLSARYVAMMKSCSTTNAVFLAWRMNLDKPTSHHNVPGLSTGNNMSNSHSRNLQH